MKVKENTALLLVMIALAAASRLLPHPPNFTAVGAIALFGGAYFQKRVALLVAIAALFLSDLILNNVIYSAQFPELYEGFVLIGKGSMLIYLTFGAIVLLGSLMLRRVRPFNVVLSSVTASMLFFLVTNFGVWVSSATYPPTISGLLTCYGVALPFFWNTLMSTVLFSAILFGGYELIKSRRARLTELAD